jgi:bacterioferritin-associated ferredoxin
MADENEKNIQKGYSTVLEGYIGKLKDNFDQLNDQGKREIMGKLEALLGEDSENSLLPKPEETLCHPQDELIDLAIKNGCQTISEIAKSTGLKYTQIARRKRINDKYKEAIKPEGHDTVSKIRELYSSGTTNIEDIAKKIGKAPSTVQNYIWGEGISRPGHKGRGAKEARELVISKIRKLSASGITDIKEIADKIGKSPSTAYRYIRQGNISIAHSKKVHRRSRGKTREIEISKVRELVESGITDAKEIAKEIGRSTSVVHHRIKKGNIYRAPSKKGRKRGGQNKETYSRGTKRKKLVDKLISEGHKLHFMAEQEGLTTERIRQYINATGQYEIWKNAKQTIKDEKEVQFQQLQQARRNLLSTLNNAVDKEAERQGWPAQKAVEYTRSFKQIKKRVVKDKTLLTIFRRYEEAQRDGENISLSKLGKGSNLHDASTSAILKRAGLQPFFEIGQRPRNKTQKKKKITSQEENSETPSVVNGIGNGAFYEGLNEEYGKDGTYNPQNLRHKKPTNS